MADEQLVSVDLVALVEDQPTGNPIVILHDRGKNRVLPIWIGEPEARSIAMVLNNVRAPRPLTHTLVLRVLGQMGGKLERIVITRLEKQTYYAALFVQTEKGLISVDARPSDAISLALEAHVSIFVVKKVMDDAGQNNPFPGFGTQQQKREFSRDELQKISELLVKARAREEQSSGEGNKKPF